MVENIFKIRPRFVNFYSLNCFSGPGDRPKFVDYLKNISQRSGDQSLRIFLKEPKILNFQRKFFKNQAIEILDFFKIFLKYRELKKNILRRFIKQITKKTRKKNFKEFFQGS